MRKISPSRSSNTKPARKSTWTPLPRPVPVAVAGVRGHRAAVLGELLGHDREAGPVLLHVADRSAGRPRGPGRRCPRAARPEGVPIPAVGVGEGQPGPPRRARWDRVVRPGDRLQLRRAHRQRPAELPQRLAGAAHDRIAVRDQQVVELEPGGAGVRTPRGGRPWSLPDRPSGCPARSGGRRSSRPRPRPPAPRPTGRGGPTRRGRSSRSRARSRRPRRAIVAEVVGLHRVVVAELVQAHARDAHLQAEVARPASRSRASGGGWSGGSPAAGRAPRRRSSSESGTSGSSSTPWSGRK